MKTEVALAAQKVLVEEVITYLYMNNADQVKYGSLMARLNTSQSLAQTVGGISAGFYGADVRPVYWMSQ